MAKNQNLETINSKIRYLLIASLSLLAITIIINWIVDFVGFHQNLVNVLEYITKQTNQNRYGFHLTPISWSIIHLLIFILTIGFLTLFGLFKTKSRVASIMSVFLLIVLAIIFVGLVLFLISLVANFTALKTAVNHQSVLLLMIPLVLLITFVIFALVSTIIMIHHTLSGMIMQKQWSFFKVKHFETSDHEDIAVTDHKQSEVTIIMPELKTNHDDEKQEFNDVDHTHTIDYQQPKIKIDEQFDTVDYTHTINFEPETVAIEIAEEIINTNHGQRPINASDFLVVKEEKQLILPEVNWTPTQINEVWDKGHIIPNVNPKLYRKDYAGAWMFFDSFVQTIPEHENPRSYDWTIVHHRPLIHGGESLIDNLEPMNIHNATTKGQNYPRWETKISSVGNENKIKVQTWKDQDIN